MHQQILICLALTNGPKTAEELAQLLDKYHQWPWKTLTDDRDELLQPVPISWAGPRPQVIRKLTDGRFELTTEGHVWLCLHQPALRFVVDCMNNLERHGLPRGESIPAPTSRE